MTSVVGLAAAPTRFTYDDRGLLLSTTGPSGDSSFAYTADGQMASRTDAAGTTTYSYDTAGRLGDRQQPGHRGARRPTTTTPVAGQPDHLRLDRQRARASATTTCTG